MGGAAGGLLGWTAIDAILDKRRKEENESELEKSRREFQEAMLNSFDRPVKVGSDTVSLGQALDLLYDKMLEKQAFLGIPNPFTENNLNNALGVYLTYAAPLAAVTGYGAFKAARKRRKQYILDKALKRRKRRMQTMQPAEIIATPVPVQVEDEEE